MSNDPTREASPGEPESARSRGLYAASIRIGGVVRRSGLIEKLGRTKLISNPNQPRSSQLVENKATSQKSTANFCTFPPGPSSFPPRRTQSPHSAIRNRHNSLIQKEKTFSNRNKKRSFSACSACLSWKRQFPDWQIRRKHRRSNGFAAHPVTAAVDLAAGLPYACLLTTLQIVAMRTRPDCGRRNGTHQSWRT
jgi:hypothetical protein